MKTLASKMIGEDSTLSSDELAAMNSEHKTQRKFLIARYASALALSGGMPQTMAEIARERYRTTPLVLRAVAEAMDTQTSGAASQLIPASTLSGTFLEALRPRTLVDRIPARRVPFNTSTPVATSGASCGWVAEGIAKPVQSMTFSSTSLTWAKCACIAVLTQELVRASGSAAENTIQDDLVNATSAVMDSQFVDESQAFINYVQNGGIIYGIAATAASAGTSFTNFKTDFKALMAAIGSTVKDPRGVVILMSATNALNLSLMDATIGRTLDVNGGTVSGLQVLVSEAVGSRLIALHAPSLLIAEGAVNISLSDQTSLEMDDVPSQGDQSPVTTISTLKSMWQNDLVAFRVERQIAWKLGRSGAVKWISGASYGA